MKKINGILLAFVFLVVSGCSGDSWEGIVFPKKENRLIYNSVGPFDTLQECQKASLAKLELLKAVENGYFDCGKNCASGASSFNRGCEVNELGNLYK